MIPSTFDLSGSTAVVTGGYGVLGGGIARSLAAAGVRVAIWGRRPEAAAALLEGIRADGGEAMVVRVDVLDEEQVRSATAAVVDAWERIDILVNAAGGNVARARSDDRPVFQVPLDAFDEALRLNLHGTVVPTMVVGEAMARQGRGSIINISSMAAIQAISGVMGYSVAKAGVDNLTRWLAVDLARRHGAGLRVNAVAPGFFVTTQNRAVLVGEDGSYTERARKIVERTPMGRFGEADELFGAIHWLCSDAASFVTGAIIPVDGGFQAFSGI
jgi:NAD(P)-dependent dehydrogenase (short-subunit alcohol dehydrogenase family)